jgi:hypothetical protein
VSRKQSKIRLELESLEGRDLMTTMSLVACHTPVVPAHQAVQPLPLAAPDGVVACRVSPTEIILIPAGHGVQAAVGGAHVNHNQTLVRDGKPRNQGRRT